MRRAVITALTLGGLTAGLLPALAAGQPVNGGPAAGISVTGRTPNGRPLFLSIAGVDLSSGPELVIATQRCFKDGSCAGESYTAALSSHAFTVDPSTDTATLRTTLSGRPLVITWEASGTPASGVEIGSGQIDGWGQADAAGEMWLGQDAKATVSYAGSQCTGDGGVGGAAIADTKPVDGNPTNQPVRSLHLAKGSALHC
jgi:hypothetical protein